MNIRLAKPGDADALATLHIDSWKQAYEGLVPDEFLENMDYHVRADRFRECFKHNKEQTYVAEEDGRIVGFLTLGVCRDEDLSHENVGGIWGIYLASGYWRKGIGTSLCRFGENLLKERGYSFVVLWVFAGNPNARRFYEAMGYTPDGASKMLNPGKPLEAVRYRKKI